MFKPVLDTVYKFFESTRIKIYRLSANQMGDTYHIDIPLHKSTNSYTYIFCIGGFWFYTFYMEGSHMGLFLPLKDTCSCTMYCTVVGVVSSGRIRGTNTICACTWPTYYLLHANWIPVHLVMHTPSSESMSTPLLYCTNLLCILSSSTSYAIRHTIRVPIFTTVPCKKLVGQTISLLTNWEVCQPTGRRWPIERHPLVRYKI